MQALSLNRLVPKTTLGRLAFGAGFLAIAVVTIVWHFVAEDDPPPAD